MPKYFIQSQRDLQGSTYKEFGCTLLNMHSNKAANKEVCSACLGRRPVSNHHRAFSCTAWYPLPIIQWSGRRLHHIFIDVKPVPSLRQSITFIRLAFSMQVVRVAATGSRIRLIGYLLLFRFFQDGLDHFVTHSSSFGEPRRKVRLDPLEAVPVRGEVSERDTVRPTLLGRSQERVSFVCI